MSWQDFDTDSALERDLLRRALPLIPTSAGSAAPSILDQTSGVANHFASATSTLGATPAGCVEALGIRPLLSSAAWKVLDLLLESAVEQAGALSAAQKRVPITTKKTLAQQHTGRPPAIQVPAWEALCGTYVGTVDLRHSLVHRRVHLTTSDDLVGVDSGGHRYVRSRRRSRTRWSGTAQLAAEMVTATTPDARTHADLERQLGYLSGLHGVTLPTIVLADVSPAWTVVVDATQAAPNEYALDLKALRSRTSAANVDLTVSFRDRPGQELSGRLETAPIVDTVSLDPGNPPPWLRSRDGTVRASPKSRRLTSIR